MLATRTQRRSRPFSTGKAPARHSAQKTLNEHTNEDTKATPDLLRSQQTESVVALHQRIEIKRRFRQIRQDLLFSAAIASGFAVIAGVCGFLSLDGMLLFLVGSLTAHVIAFRALAA